VRDLVLYLRDVVRIFLGVDSQAHIIEAPVIDVQDDHRGGLEMALRYSDGSELHIELWADCSGDEIRWPSYSLHYQDRDRRLRFRFDNAPHHPELADFPRHVHRSDAEIEPGGPPSVHEVARLIERRLRGESDSDGY
jgi:hypothetical protein